MASQTTLVDVANDIEAICDSCEPLSEAARQPRCQSDNWVGVASEACSSTDLSEINAMIGSSLRVERVNRWKVPRSLHFVGRTWQTQIQTGCTCRVLVDLASGLEHWAGWAGSGAIPEGRGCIGR